MGISPLRLDVGKIRSTGTKFPWEPGFVASVRAQCDELQAIIEDIVQQFIDGSPQITKFALQPTFDKSQIYCPVDTGALRESGFLEIAGFRGQPRVEMGYARGGNPFYAVIVHEDLLMSHKPPTRAQWLKAALDEDLVQIQERIAQGHQEFFDAGAHWV